MGARWRWRLRCPRRGGGDAESLTDGGEAVAFHSVGEEPGASYSDESAWRDVLEESPQEFLAAESLNFHLSLVFYGICLVPLCFVVIGIPLLVILGLVSLILALVAAVRASDGILYHYPLTIRLVK